MPRQRGIGMRKPKKKKVEPLDNAEKIPLPPPAAPENDSRAKGVGQPGVVRLELSSKSAASFRPLAGRLLTGLRGSCRPRR